MNLKKPDLNKKEKPEKKVKESKEIKLDVARLKTYFNKNTFLGITLVGFLVLMVVYVFVYLDYTQRTEELEASNRQLKSTVEELQEYNDNMENYKAAIEEMKAVIEETMSAYPADAREEDAIMLAVNIQENSAIAYDAINMEETEGVYTVPFDMVKLAAIEGMDRDLVFAQKRAVYVNTTNYENLKSVIEQVYKSDNRIGIGNIVYAKNEEDGTLEGNIDLYFYSAAGTGKEYVVPDIAEYISGTNDIFKCDNVRLSSIVEESAVDEAPVEQEAQ